jgi:membrane protease YdiL (CAAX protease family)
MGIVDMDDTLPVAGAPRSRLSWIFVGDDGLRAGWSIVLFFIFVALLTIGLVLIVRAVHPGKLAVGAGMSPETAILQEALSLIAVGVAALLMSLIERRRFGRYNLAAPAPAADFVKGLVWGVVMLSILVALLDLTGGIAFDGAALSGGAIVSYGVEWLIAFLLVALFEEFAFRGYLQFTLARGITGIVRTISPQSRAAPTIGFWVAAISLSIVLFAVAHTTNGGETPMGIISVSLAGLLLVFSLWWTGSLCWAIGFHCAWDWAQSYLYGVADSGMVSKGHLLATHPIGPELLSGGATGPEGSVLVIPVVLLAIAAVWKTMPRRLPPVVDGRA